MQAHALRQRDSHGLFLPRRVVRRDGLAARLRSRCDVEVAVDPRGSRAPASSSTSPRLKELTCSRASPESITSPQRQRRPSTAQLTARRLRRAGWCPSSSDRTSIARRRSRRRCSCSTRTATRQSRTSRREASSAASFCRSPRRRGVLGAGVLAADAPMVAVLVDFDRGHLRRPDPLSDERLRGVHQTKYLHPWGRRSVEALRLLEHRQPGLHPSAFDRAARHAVCARQHGRARAVPRPLHDRAVDGRSFSTPPTTPPTVTVKAYFSAWAQPDAHDLMEVPIQQSPDGLICVTLRDARSTRVERWRERDPSHADGQPKFAASSGSCATRSTRGRT